MRKRHEYQKHIINKNKYNNNGKIKVFVILESKYFKAGATVIFQRKKRC